MAVSSRQRRRPRRAPSAAAVAESSQPTRLKILEGAARAFGERGFAEATVDDIIGAAGVSRPSFYKFFSNKDVVFDLLHETHMLSLIQVVKGAVRAAPDTDSKVDRAADAYLRWIVAIGPLAHALYTESRRPGSRLHQRYRDTVTTLAVFFQDEAAELDITGVDPLVYSGLVAACEAVGVSLLASGRVGDAEVERRKRVIATLVRGTLRAATGRGDTL